MTNLAKWIASAIALVVGLIPFKARRFLLRTLLLVESRIGQPKNALARLFAVADDLDRLIAERATAYGGGINPKHRMTRYHDFFVQRIKPGQRVLDIGCGVGEVARSIATAIPGAHVVGIDIDEPSLARARKRSAHPNLIFVKADATAGLPEGPWDVVVMSNVLEHIADRVGLLKTIINQAHPNVLLFRVPLFERHWHMPLRKEVGADFRSDPTHFIEHSLAEFDAELDAAGLEIAERITLWGEIWAQARVRP
jgi:SAM-dependent methyltransferase